MAVILYEEGIFEGSLLIMEIDEWLADEIEMYKQSKLALTTFF
jgi:hypothetical protein